MITDEELDTFVRSWATVDEIAEEKRRRKLDKRAFLPATSTNHSNEEVDMLNPLRCENLQSSGVVR